MQPSAEALDQTEVFISYRTAETSSDAQLLYRLLKERGLNVFLDVDALRAGTNWDDFIKRALSSPSLAVGVVLMTHDWFQNITEHERWLEFAGKDEKPGIVVWREISTLRERQAATPQQFSLMPAVIRRRNDDNTSPPLPSPTPGFAELSTLHADLEKLQFRYLVPELMTRFDGLVGEIFDRVCETALDRPLIPEWEIPARRTPPLSVRALGTDPVLRRRVGHYGRLLESAQHGTNVTVEAETILGQEALLDHDYPVAIGRLAKAAKLAVGRSGLATEPARPASTEEARARLWHAHALNLFVLASLRGARPRRLQITEASQLLHALSDALALAANSLAWWPPGHGHQATADRKSLAYVLDTTLLLLWLLWADFFRARNVGFPESAVARRKDVVLHLGAASLLLRRLWGSGPDELGSDHLHLVKAGFLDSLPPALADEETWTAASAHHEIERVLEELNHR